MGDLPRVNIGECFEGCETIRAGMKVKEQMVRAKTKAIIADDEAGIRLMVARSAELGADGHITKPFSVEGLLAATAKYAPGST